MVQALLDTIDGLDEGGTHLGPDGAGGPRPVYGIGLIRVSGGPQAKEGLSLDTQPDELRVYCRRARILLNKIYEEPAVRGWKERDQRPEYAAALAHATRLAREGKRVAFVVTWVDRLGRNHPEQSQALVELDRADVQVHTAVEFGGGRLDEDLGGLATWLAERNNRQHGMKVGGVWANTRGKGWAFAGRKAWGYDHRERTPEEKDAGAPKQVLVPHPVESPFAREALERLAAGQAVAAVHRWVASLPAEARGGRTMGLSTFRDSMKRSVYAGRPAAAEGRPRAPGRFSKKLWRREDAPKLPETPEEVLALPRGRWEPLVSDAVWLAAQRTLAPGTRSPGRPATSGRYLLTGLPRCPQCGGRLVGRWDLRSETGRYVCTAFQRKPAEQALRPDGKPCRFSCSARSLEGGVLEGLEAIRRALVPDDPRVEAAAATAYEAIRQRRPEEDAAVVVLREALMRLRRDEKAVHQRLAGYVDLLMEQRINQTAYDAAQAEAQTGLDRVQTEERRLRAELERLTGSKAGSPAVDNDLPPWEVIKAALLPRTGEDWRAMLLRGRGAGSGKSPLSLLVETVVPRQVSFGVYRAEIGWTRLGHALREVARLLTESAA